MNKRAEPYLLLPERALNRLETYVPVSVEDYLGQPVFQDAILLRVVQIGENLFIAK